MITRTRTMLYPFPNPATEQFPLRRLCLLLNYPPYARNQSNWQRKDRLRNGYEATPRMRMQRRCQPKIAAPRLNCLPRFCQSYLRILHRMHRINTREPGLFETLCKCRLIRLTKVWETTKPRQICLITQIRDGRLSIRGRQQFSRSSISQPDTNGKKAGRVNTVGLINSLSHNLASCSMLDGCDLGILALQIYNDGM